VPISDPDLEGFLLLLAAQRSPRTLDAYRRDLTAFATFRGGALAETTTAGPRRRSRAVPLRSARSSGISSCSADSATTRRPSSFSRAVRGSCREPSPLPRRND
jgi:hypothetical protein